MLIETNTRVNDQIQRENKAAGHLIDYYESNKLQTQKELDDAATNLKVVKSQYNELESERKKITVPLDQSKKSIMALFKPVLDKLKLAEMVIKENIQEFNVREIERLKQEQLKAEIEARKIESKKQDSLLRRANKAESKGNLLKANGLKEEAEQVYVTRTICSLPSKSDGVSVSTKWKYRVTDLSKVPREYLKINEAAIDPMKQTAKAMANGKRTINTIIPGIEFYEDNIVSVRIK